MWNAKKSIQKTAQIVHKKQKVAIDSLPPPTTTTGKKKQTIAAPRCNGSNTFVVTFSQFLNFYFVFF